MSEPFRKTVITFCPDLRDPDGVSLPVARVEMHLDCDHLNAEQKENVEFTLNYVHHLLQDTMKNVLCRSNFSFEDKPG